MYAIIKTGGKQYTVRENEILEVEKLDIAAGEQVALDSVLFVSTDKGAVIGTPVVEGAKVTAKVLRHGLGKKIIGFTYKAKKNVRGRFGHRQPSTRIQIEKIEYAA
jgi:large subunit ribosomal protein L21